MSTTMKNELGEYAVRAGPGLGATGLSLFGIPIADVVQVLVAIYTVVQIGVVVANYFKKKQNGS